MNHRGFSHCKGACGKMIRLFGWDKHTFTYQRSGYCRQCFKKNRRKALGRGKGTLRKERK